MAIAKEEVLEKVGPWHWRKGKWNIHVKFEPVVHVLVESPLVRRPIMFSAAETAMVCSFPETIERWTKIPKYLHEDLIMLTCRARRVAKAVEEAEIVPHDVVIHHLASRG